jgi:hypothetical protein
MALCRCKAHEPRGTRNNYIVFVEPIGYHITSSICGRANCTTEGVIWLTKEEYADYLNGVDIFSYTSAVTKVRVKKHK